MQIQAKIEDPIPTGVHLMSKCQAAPNVEQDTAELGLPKAAHEKTDGILGAEDNLTVLSFYVHVLWSNSWVFAQPM